MRTINGKALYTPKGAALEYGRVGCNFYTGCPHNCTYCYLKRGITGKALGGTEVRLKRCFKDSDHAFEVFKREATQHLDHLRETGVFFSFTTDPLITETQDLTTQAVCWLNRHGIESWLLTKNATFFESLVFQALIVGNPDINKSLIHFGFTLTGRDDMEPNASSNEERIDAMRILHYAGFPTWASLEPIIDWTSTELHAVTAIPYCDHYKIGLRSGVKKDYYNPKEVVEQIALLCTLFRKADRSFYLKESVRKVLREHADEWPLAAKYLNDVSDSLILDHYDRKRNKSTQPAVRRVHRTLPCPGNTGAQDRGAGTPRAALHGPRKQTGRQRHHPSLPQD